VTTAILAGAYLRGIEEKPVPCCASTTSPLTPSRLPRPWCRSPASAVDGRVVVPRADRVLGSRIEIIVHFLALLELCKLGLVELGQGSTFGDVQISWIDEGSDLDIEGLTSMRDEHSLEQILEAMLTVALEPISAEELADVVETDAADVTTTCAGSVANFSRNDEASNSRN